MLEYVLLWTARCLIARGVQTCVQRVSSSSTLTYTVALHLLRRFGTRTPRSSAQAPGSGKPCIPPPLQFDVAQGRFRLRSLFDLTSVTFSDLCTHTDNAPLCSRVCSNRHGLIRKYGLMICRQCFQLYAKDIGFTKVGLPPLCLSSSVHLLTVCLPAPAVPIIGAVFIKRTKNNSFMTFCWWACAAK